MSQGRDVPSIYAKVASCNQPPTGRCASMKQRDPRVSVLARVILCRLCPLASGRSRVALIGDGDGLIMWQLGRRSLKRFLSDRLPVLRTRTRVYDYYYGVLHSRKYRTCV